MLTGIHFLLTYQCTYECDHCFVYSSPRAQGTFTLNQVERVLDEAIKIGTVNTVYFEGGEPMLFYPLLLACVKRARELGLHVGIVTNGYFATSERDAELWLRPLKELGLADLSISDDTFHSDAETSPAKYALAAARKLGIATGSICIEPPTVAVASASRSKGEPIVGGDVQFRGRAVNKLAQNLPVRPWNEFTECPHEELVNPGRVHVDAYGNVHLCQGLCIGNMWQTPLSMLVKSYRSDTHPIARSLVAGGPAQLATDFKVAHVDGYVDACHLCFAVRSALIEQFPQFLAPKQVYGLE
jgi:hypothetical protein